jgi:hypothetical protein
VPGTGGTPIGKVKNPGFDTLGDRHDTPAPVAAPADTPGGSTAATRWHGSARAVGASSRVAYTVLTSTPSSRPT